MVGPAHYITLSAVLFTIGVIGVLTRKNAIIVFMAIEIMLNAANLALVTFAMTIGHFRRHFHEALPSVAGGGGGAVARCGAAGELHRADLHLQTLAAD